MDKDVVDLVVSMEKMLSFVEDTDSLREKLNQFTDTVNKVLQGIAACSKAIREYIDASLPGGFIDDSRVPAPIYLSISSLGQTWQAFVEAEKLKNFKSQLAELQSDLNTNLLIYIARKAGK